MSSASKGSRKTNERILAVLDASRGTAQEVKTSQFSFPQSHSREPHLKKHQKCPKSSLFYDYYLVLSTQN
jgi:hypothetical protein